ncbi:MAG: serine hydrolase [Aliifodinibius sp.]|nr:serine hydrolase [Fodinibius sp.]
MLNHIKYQILALLIFNVGFAQDNDLESRIDQYLSPLIEGKNFSGSILIHQKNEIVLSKGYGLANIPFEIKNSPQTKFHIASLSKSFTAAAILLLDEKGSIQVGDFVIKYIPELSNFENVTIHHLLSHTSGIPDINRQRRYRNLLKKNQTASALIDVIKEYEPIFEPGAKYSYSNSNYNILARIIEVTSDQDYGTFLRKYIFDPLGLTNTAHHQHMGQLIKHSADGYVPAGGYTSVEHAPYIDWSVKTGNGSLYSTTEDLLKWMTALMGGKVLSESSLNKMLEEKYGWFVRKKMGEEVIYYNGNSPGFNSYLGHFPKRDITIIVLGNNDIPLATTIGEGLAALRLNKEVQEFEDLNPINVDQEFTRSIEGTYKFPWYSFDIIAGNNMLVYKGGYPYYEVSMIPLTKKKLFNRFFWTNLVVERGENGQATHVYWEGNPQQKGTRINK